ncbi:MAG: SEC-C domain-containing protein [Oligoflexales bacterium]|nr:SEC-C domain-containing protein [Oligoflexales bacterium]
MNTSSDLPQENLKNTTGAEQLLQTSIIEHHHHHETEHVHGPNCSHDHHHHQQPYMRAGEKIGRNDPCLCGSGKKFKKCCLEI